MPSSGNSTLLNALTHTNVKTAEYHFTTLEPNLGVLFVNRFIPNNNREIVIADIPGLIEGAAEGKGLGHDFLRHIERTKVLVHLLDGAKILTQPTEVLLKDYEIINKELQKWNENLTKKPQVIAINKIDLPEVQKKSGEIKAIFENKLGIKFSKIDIEAKLKADIDIKTETNTEVEAKPETNAKAEAKTETQAQITKKPTIYGDILFISAATNKNLNNLVEAIVKVLNEEQLKQDSQVQKKDKDNDLVEFTMDTLPNKRIIFRRKPEKITSVGPNSTK